MIHTFLFHRQMVNISNIQSSFYLYPNSELLNISVAFTCIKWLVPFVHGTASIVLSFSFSVVGYLVWDIVGWKCRAENLGDAFIPLQSFSSIKMTVALKPYKFTQQNKEDDERLCRWNGNKWIILSTNCPSTNRSYA